MNNKIFYIDDSTDRVVTYQMLFDDLKSTFSYSNCCGYKDFYDIFKHIILSILLDEEVVLVDSDFTKSEKEELLSDIEEKTIPITNLNDLSINFIQKKVYQNKNWTLSLFTSGTTGQPKKIQHTQYTLLNNIKINLEKENDVWGYAYSPTHMAGIQVFFQAMLNGNTIVKLFGKSKREVLSNIIKNNISHISATPTFYRLLLPKENTLEKVKQVTFGGEKLSPILKDKLYEVFPNAKFLNIYASTEAGTIFASTGDSFFLKKSMLEFVKVEDGVLYIHKSKIGKSTSLKLSGDWYNTGDIVRVLKEKPLTVKFLSRQNEMINVGGYKVNPYDIEDKISEMKEVSNVRVFGKPNSVLGNIICADIVLVNGETLTKQDVLDKLKEDLQGFKIPRIIKFVGEIEKTRTGKVKRIL